MEVGAESLYLKTVQGKKQSGCTDALLVMPAFTAWLVWPAIVALPVVLTHHDLYRSVFPAEWYDLAANPALLASPSPLGLSLGLLAVVVGQVAIILYHSLHVSGSFGPTTPVQRAGPPSYGKTFFQAMVEHLSQPEGFVMLGSYLCLYWMLNLMPATYYSFEGGIDWVAVALQLLLQDVVQYLMHLGEHKVSAAVYRVSHKPHHRFTNPKLFDAFNGSPTDTLLMILLPLLVTSRVVHCNVWSYMAFGSLYANWLCLIHSEFEHPWDWLFRKVGFGTAADHHIHHKLFVKNYGHLFMYADWLFGTYKDAGTLGLFSLSGPSPAADADKKQKAT